MSLEQATVAAPEASGSAPEPTPASSAPDSDLNSKYEGFSSPDTPEPDEAKPADTGTEAQPGEQRAQAADENGGDQSDELDTAEADPWEGYEEIEIDGKKLKIHADAKPYLLRHADYTRKTMELGDRSKALDAREAQIVQRQNLTDQEIGAYVHLNQLNEQLKEFEGIDWNAELAKARVSDDPLALTDLTAKHAQFQELLNLHKQGTDFLTEAAKTKTSEAEQATANRIAATTDFAQKNLAKLGWTEKMAGEINAWMMTENGFTVDTLKAAYSPQSYPIIFKAFLWDQSLKRQQSATPLKAAPAAKPAPTQSVTAKANVARSFDPETSSMDDYAKEWAARQKRR